MKILFVTYHGLGFGGAEVSTKYLAEEMKILAKYLVIQESSL